MNLRDMICGEAKKTGFAIVCCGEEIDDNGNATTSDHFNATCNVCGATYLITRLKMASCSTR